MHNIIIISAWVDTGRSRLDRSVELLMRSGKMTSHKC